uniref:Dichloromethane dehalogenase n=1 Tax=Methylophilus leisingeri (strain DSM 6813 / VKM B-2013 / DM11) TaxID=45393 RepID=DCMA_METLD|nr:RecName: Full=Dichloromethane dehalogenase; Short=DCM dehalogenase [Methylophilus leisingeri]AAA25443.1 Dichloromethane Dehalogenase / Glutathione S-Transferase [Methylophilus sp.]
MSTKLRYLHHPASQPCRAVHQFMLENNIEFQEEIVDITTDINEQPEFRERYNPTGQVPILVDGDFTIWESAAIVYYLSEKYDCSSSWWGSTLEERGHIQQYMHWYAYTLRLGGGAFHWTIFAPMIYGYDKDFTVEVTKGRFLLYESFDILEKYWLKDGDYLCGNTLSYPDLATCQDLVSHDAGRIIPTSMWDSHPKVKAWFARMMDREHAKTVSAWQYENVRKYLDDGVKLNFQRKTAVLKGTEVYSGHNNGIIYNGDDDSFVTQHG